MASISEECSEESVEKWCGFWSSVCFLSWRIGVKRMFLVHGKIFHLVDPVQHQDVFSNDLLGDNFSSFCNCSFHRNNWLKFSNQRHKDGTHLNLGALPSPCSQRRFLSFRIHSTQLSNCMKSISLAMFTWLLTWSLKTSESNINLFYLLPKSKHKEKNVLKRCLIQCLVSFSPILWYHSTKNIFVKLRRQMFIAFLITVKTHMVSTLSDILKNSR